MAKRDVSDPMLELLIRRLLMQYSAMAVQRELEKQAPGTVAEYSAERIDALQSRVFELRKDV